MENEDIGAHQYAYHDRGHVHEFQLRSKSFYASEQWHRSPDLKLRADQDKTPFRKARGACVSSEACIGPIHSAIGIRLFRRRFVGAGARRHAYLDLRRSSDAVVALGVVAARRARRAEMRLPDTAGGAVIIFRT